MKLKSLLLAAVLTSMSMSLISQTVAVAAEESGAKTEGAQTGEKLTWRKPLIPVAEDFTLKNGLRVILSEDHSVPVASVAIVYDVGSRNEVKGRSGFAHLFEHMMFEGSENVAKTEHFKYIEAAGGTLNASTHNDFTNYFEKVPSNELELALWLESDRMRSLKVTTENFKNQLDTVKEEKRSRIDNQPYVPAEIKMEEMLFDNWANSHPTIGSFDDLEASSVEDVRQFFKTYYAPNNAVMAIVGDIDAAKTHQLVEKYFGSISSQPLPPKPDVAEPVQKTAKYLKVDDPQAQTPAFWLSFKAPPRRDPDGYVLGIIEKILGSGESSRLFQRMVKGDQIALAASASYGEQRGPGSFETTVIYKPNTTAEKAREVVWDEFEKLKKTPVSQEELDKAKNQVLGSLFSSSSYVSLQRSLGRAEMLAEYASFWGNPQLIDKDLEAYLKVTPADVQRVAAQIFSKEGSTVVDDVPTAKKSSLDNNSIRTATKN